MSKLLFQEMAGVVGALKRSVASKNEEWIDKHSERLQEWVSRFFPSGSGFDMGTKFDVDASSEEKLVFSTSFHHMNSGGFYDGWTDHTIVVRPSLAHGFRLTIGGRNRNDIKDVIHEAFDYALRFDLDV